MTRLLRLACIAALLSACEPEKQVVPDPAQPPKPKASVEQAQRLFR